MCACDLHINLLKINSIAIFVLSYSFRCNNVAELAVDNPWRKKRDRTISSQRRRGSNFGRKTKQTGFPKKLWAQSNKVIYYSTLAFEKNAYPLSYII